MTTLDHSKSNLTGQEPMSTGYGRRLVPKVMSSNPSTVYWMDMFSHFFVVKIVMCV